jgi:hypothetical protein
MMSMRERLLALTIRRITDITIEGEVFRVREPTAGDVQDFIALREKAPRAAMAGLMAACMVDESDQPFLSPEDALAIADVPRLATPIVDALTAAMSGQKKG